MSGPDSFGWMRDRGKSERKKKNEERPEMEHTTIESLALSLPVRSFSRSGAPLLTGVEDLLGFGD